ncbi:MAG TPA: inositol 2-dehydrogenase [Candidatus Hydrogenedentes bacterium]|nr:inositol 2-dehydrogenase [Candidatus Hydrogenedentota bacterium]
MSATLNVGLIGTGRIGKVHAEHLAHRIPRVKLSVISDMDEASAKTCAEKLGVHKVAKDYKQVLQDPAVNAVVICTPTDTHAQLIEEAAVAGKHIFCEKPIAQTLPKIDRAVGAVKKAGVKLQVGFNRRFDPNFARAKQAIASGEIGELHLLHIISRDPGPPPISYVKVSGGIFLDMTIHDFDMARFLAGSEVTEVYTAAAVLVDPAIGEAGDLDTAMVLLTFENGEIGCIDNSRKAVYGYDQRVEALGSAGAVQVSNNYPNSAVISDAANVKRDLPLNFFMDRYTESFMTEMNAFVSAVVENTPVPVTGHDGRMAVVVGLAARKSYDEHRPVKISEIG